MCLSLFLHLHLSSYSIANPSSILSFVSNLKPCSSHQMIPFMPPHNLPISSDSIHPNNQKSGSPVELELFKSLCFWQEEKQYSNQVIKSYLKAKLKMSVYNLANYLSDMKFRSVWRTRHVLGLQIYSIRDLSSISKLFHWCLWCDLAHWSLNFWEAKNAIIFIFGYSYPLSYSAFRNRKHPFKHYPFI